MKTCPAELRDLPQVFAADLDGSFSRLESAALAIAAGTVVGYNAAETGRRAVLTAEAVLAAAGGREQELGQIAHELTALSASLDGMDRTEDDRLPATDELRVTATLTDKLLRQLAAHCRDLAARLDPFTPLVSGAEDDQEEDPRGK